MTSWDGGRDAPDPNWGASASTDWPDIRHLRNHGQQPVFVEGLGNVCCKTCCQTFGDITVINTAADGNCGSYVALQYSVGARAKSGQQLEAAAIRQAHVADEQVKYLAFCRGQRAGCTGRTNHHVTVTDQQSLAGTRYSVVIFHEQDAQRRIIVVGICAAPRCCHAENVQGG